MFLVLEFSMAIMVHKVGPWMNWRTLLQSCYWVHYCYMSKLFFYIVFLIQDFPWAACAVKKKCFEVNGIALLFLFRLWIYSLLNGCWITTSCWIKSYWRSVYLDTEEYDFLSQNSLWIRVPQFKIFQTGNFFNHHLNTSISLAKIQPRGQGKTFSLLREE